MDKQVVYDLGSFEIVTDAIMELLNKFPLLGALDEISFSVLNPESGKAMFPTSGPVVLQEIEDISGEVEQTCSYPFTIVYRSAGLSEGRKSKTQEWLDTLGKWLEKQPIKVGKDYVKLEEYPVLTGQRKFKKISRSLNANLFQTSEDKVEDWIIAIQATYSNKFDRE